MKRQLYKNLEQLFLPSQSSESQYCAHIILHYMDVVIKLHKSSGRFISNREAENTVLSLSGSSYFQA